MTKAERKVNYLLIKLGIPVIYQQIIYPYIVDFVGLDRNFILEVDGGVHYDRERYDDRRSANLEKKGFKVYRVDNNDIVNGYVHRIIAQTEKVPKGYMENLIIKANYAYCQAVNA